MKNREFFHVHASNKFDNIWTPNSEFEVNDNFKSMMYQRYITFNTNFDVIDPATEEICKESFPSYAQEALLRSLTDEEKKVFISNIDRRYYTEDQFNELVMSIMQRIRRQELLYLLQEARRIAGNANTFKRETALEDCRKDNFPSLPSRLHSLFLTEEDMIEHWASILEQDNRKEVSVYRVEIEHDPFKTNEQLLPNENGSYIDVYREAKRYWTAKKDNSRAYVPEYLYQGHVKVLERVK